MRAITLTQPWASLVALGHKKVETRSWRPIRCFAETVAIHAAKGFPRAARVLAAEERSLGRLPERLPFGAIVAVARVADYVSAWTAASSVSGLERRLGDFSSGRWAWFFDQVVALRNPIFCRGALGLWRLPEDVDQALSAELFSLRKSASSTESSS